MKKERKETWKPVCTYGLTVLTYILSQVFYISSFQLVQWSIYVKCSHTLLLTYRSVKPRWVSFRVWLKRIKKQKVRKSPDIASCVTALSRVAKTNAFSWLPLQNTWTHMPSALRDRSVSFTHMVRSTGRIRVPIDCRRTNVWGKKKSMPTWKTPGPNRIQFVQKSDSKCGKSMPTLNTPKT